MITAVVAGSFVAAYAVLQSLGVDPLPSVGSAGNRVFSTYGNPDMLGTYLVFPFVLALGLGLSTSRGWPSLRRVGVYGLLIGWALAATTTRGAWIGALVAVLCLGSGAVGPGVEGYPPNEARRGDPRCGAAGQRRDCDRCDPTETSVTRATPCRRLLASVSNGRTVIWATGLRGVADPANHGLGSGRLRAERSKARSGADWYAIIGGLRGATNAHGMLVQVLVTLGIPGLVLTVWALAVGSRSRRFARSQPTKGTARVHVRGILGRARWPDVALLFGVTLPAVVVWVWLAVGVLARLRLAQGVRRLPKTGACVGHSRRCSARALGVLRGSLPM